MRRSGNAIAYGAQDAAQQALRCTTINVAAVAKLPAAICAASTRQWRSVDTICCGMKPNGATGRAVCLNRISMIHLVSPLATSITRLRSGVSRFISRPMMS